MRTSTGQVYVAWRLGRSFQPSKAIWTDGVSIYSYSTAILTRTGRHEGRRPGEVVLNLTTYSQTTTTHQNGLKELLAREKAISRVLELGSLPWKVAASDLIAIAYAEVTTAELFYPGPWSRKPEWRTA